MNKQIANFTDKPITKFTNSDTLYITKNVSGYSHTFMIQFVSYKANIVVGKILEIQPNNTKSLFIKNKCYTIGSEISGNIGNCYTFSNRCHWFEKDDKTKIWSCK